MSLVSGAVPVVVLAAGLAAPIALTARRDRRWWTRAVPLAVLAGVLSAAMAALVVDVLWRPFPDTLAFVLITALAQVNQLYYVYPTLHSALGLTPPQQASFAHVARPLSRVVTAQPGVPLTDAWTPPADMPTTGAVSEVPIPGTVSSFVARPAWVYFPPAYRAHPERCFRCSSRSPVSRGLLATGWTAAVSWRR
jgi:hypothetical protein